jgi:hypothetical protein
MRPKTVFLIMIAAVGLLAVMVIFKALFSGGEIQGSQPIPAPVAVRETTAPPPVVSGGSPWTNVVAKTPEQERQERLEKDLDEVREDFANGRPATLLAKLNSKEPEVRKEVIEAIKQLDYRDAIPNLKEALNQTEDMREKMSILEAIESLQAPPGMQVPEGSLDAHTNPSMLSKKFFEGQLLKSGSSNRSRRSVTPK